MFLHFFHINQPYLIMILKDQPELCINNVNKNKKQEVIRVINLILALFYSLL